ncbi:TolB family protein [Deinococcus sp.]|uniref:TolB family protein n=1 Tax=Deinococcus sp. TaxID=47478 RepID=UPI003CC5F580
MRPFLPVLFLLTAAQAAAATLPPAGTYQCDLLQSGTTTALNPDGTLRLDLTPRVHSSFISTLKVDGKGNYTVDGKQKGTYSYVPQTHRISFQSGYLKGYQSMLERRGSDAGIRIGDKTGKFDADERYGEYLCTLGNAAGPLPANLTAGSGQGGTAQGGTAKPAGPANSTLTGLLLYRQQYQPGMIAAIDLKTGREQTLTKGSSISASSNGLWAIGSIQDGTVVFVRPSGDIVGQFRRQQDDVSGDVRLSRDGGKVAFRSYDTTKGTGVQITDQAGHDLAFFPDLDSADWLPDGRLVAATPERPDTLEPGLYLLSPGSSKPTPLGRNLVNPIQPTVSPDGKRVAFSMNGHLWVIGIDGSGLKQVSSGDGSERLPGWSPDGQSLVAQRTGNYKDGLYIFPLNGKSPMQLLDAEGRAFSSDAPPIWLAK